MINPVPTTFQIEKSVLKLSTELSEAIGISRSEFFRQAIEMYCQMNELSQLIKKHKER
jgi:metal-responsive CopG/Arc/MetJ family transcriptional regulator